MTQSKPTTAFHAWHRAGHGPSQSNETVLGTYHRASREEVSPGTTFARTPLTQYVGKADLSNGKR